MNVHGPCIVGKVTPIVHENSELHDDQWNDHPFVEVLVFLQRGGQRLGALSHGLGAAVKRSQT